MANAIIEQIIGEVPRDFHISGSLSPAVLWRIAELHEQVGATVSAETGCGLTTLVLSHLSERHTSFTVDFGDSLPNTRGHALFNSASTSFVVNPTQISLPAHRFTSPLDFAILDGPHAYPFPDLEYFYFYPHVRTGGVLVIDDIHIPTIGHLYDFLLDDEMWEHLGDVETTAFFMRTSAPTLDPYGDGWPSQRYNRRYFEYPHALNGAFGEGWFENEFGAEPIKKNAKFVSTINIETLISKQQAESVAKIDALQKAVSALRAEAAYERSSREAVYQSTSWRITAPVRALKRLLR